MTVPKPPKPGDFRAGQQLSAGLGKATVLPDIDFETYSEAGYLWNEATRSWDRLPGSGSKKKGLSTVGVAAYSEHPTADVLLAAFDLKDGQGAERWRPGMPVPPRWRAHVEAGGLVEAHNAPYEAWMNRNILVPRYGFPVVQDWQWRCSMAKCRAWSMPPSLGEVGDVLNIRSKKDKDGERLMGIFSWPRKPTKADPRMRILPTDDPVNFERYADYNQRDIEAEAEVSRAAPDLMPVEQEYWLIDFRINQRGVYVDRAGMDNCIAIIEQAHERYNTELAVLTGGAVTKASELQKLVGWMGAYKLFATSLDEENVDAWLERIDKAERAMAEFEAANVATPQTAIDPYLEFDDIYQITDLPRVKRALEIRREVGSAAVKKVFAMRCQLTRDDRLHDLFTFHGARTGRPTGSGPQPTNMPNSGPEVYRCADCARYFPVAMGTCQTCGGKPAARCKVCKQYVSGPSCCGVVRSPKPYAAEWSAEAAESALEAIATRSLEYVEMVWGDAMPTVSGCLRGLYTAAPGHDLIGSDYSAIEAVVNAALSGEKWRMDVFRTHGKIYEASAANTFKVPLEEILDYQKTTGNKHPLRFKGKVTELALGYLGWIGALRQMGFEGSDGEAKELIIAWQKASPAIVHLGGGQYVDKFARPKVDYLHGLEGMAVACIRQPNKSFPVLRLDGTPSGLTMITYNDVMYMILPDGTKIAYHHPRLHNPTDNWRGMGISFEGYNTNPKAGPFGWITMHTYSGKLLENACQAVANRILRFGQVQLEAAGYPIVLHVYDENVCEVPHGFGSVEEMERIMSIMPEWACDDEGPWPIKANGGWRGLRYRK